MEEEVEERIHISVNDTMESARLREEKHSVGYGQEPIASFQNTSPPAKTSSLDNLYSVAKEALDIPQQEDPFHDAGQNTTETLRFHPAVSAGTKARWELLRALVGVEDKIPQPVKRQEPSSDNEDYHPSVRLRRSLARRGRRPLSASPSHGMRPLLLPQKVLNDRAASPTPSKDPSPAFLSETQEATHSDLHEYFSKGADQTSSEHGQSQKTALEGLPTTKNITPGSSQLEVEGDRTFFSPTTPSMRSAAPQNTASPSQAQSGPRQSQSSTHTPQQQTPIPYHNTPPQVPLNQSSAAGGIPGRPPSHGVESQSLVQPMSTSTIGQNSTLQSQAPLPRHLMSLQQNLSSEDQALNPTLRLPADSRISQSLGPQQQIPQINSQRPPSQEIRPAPVSANPSQSILPVPAEKRQGMPPGPQSQQRPAPVLHSGSPHNVQQRLMPSGQQPVIPTQQRLALPVQQSVPSQLQKRNPSSPQQLPPAGFRPPDTLNAQHLPSSTPQNRTLPSQTSPKLGNPTLAAPQSRTPQPSMQQLPPQQLPPQQLPSQQPSAVPQIHVRATPPPLPPRSNAQQPLSQNRPNSRPPQLQQTPFPNQPSQQRLGSQASQQTRLPPQNLTPSQNRPSSQNVPPSQRPLQNLPPSQHQNSQLRTFASEQNPGKSSRNSPEARQQRSDPQQHPQEPRLSQESNPHLHPAPPQKPTPALGTAPAHDSNPQTRSRLQDSESQHPLTQGNPSQAGIAQQVSAASSEHPFQGYPQHPLQQAIQPTTPATYPTNHATPAIPNSNNARNVRQDRPSTTAINQSFQQPQMTSQRPSQAKLQPLPFPQPQTNDTLEPGQVAAISLGLTRKPLGRPIMDRPLPDFANGQTETSGQSRLLAQDPKNTTVDRGETQPRPPLPEIPPQLEGQNSNPRTPISSSANPPDPSRPGIPAMSEFQPSHSPRPENGSGKAAELNLSHGLQSNEPKTMLRIGTSVLGEQRNQNQHENDDLDPKQERKPKQKLSMEQVLALWLQGELPDDYLSTESGKQMIPESKSMPPFLPKHISRCPGT